MLSRLKHVLLALTIGVALTLGAATWLRASSHTGYNVPGDVLCVVPHDSPPGPFPACDQIFTSVQTAVDASVDGQKILIASGIYTDVHTRNGIAQIVYISKSVTLRGGYAPPFDAPPDPSAQPTTLDAQGEGRVIYITGDITATLSGLHITGGNATGDDGWPHNGDGGGVIAIGATVSISNSVIYSNTASEGEEGVGGGLAFFESTVTLIGNTIQGNLGSQSWFGVGGGLSIGDSTFFAASNRILNNTAVVTNVFNGYGGGVAIFDSSGHLVDNLIDGNIASAESGTTFGGGVFLGAFEAGRRDTVMVHNNTVQNNVGASAGGPHTGGNGGGICVFNYESEATLTVQLSDNVVRDNIAAVPGIGLGGGIWMGAHRSTSVTLTHNLVSSNTAAVDGEGFGGGILAYEVVADFEGNRIVSNTASLSATVADGGGVYVFNSQVEQQAEILQGNFANRSGEGVGGGAVFEFSDAMASNLVVIDNQAATDGAGIAIKSSSVKLVHPTVARNRGGSGIYVQTCSDPSCSPNTVALTNTVLVSHAVGMHVTDGSTVTVDGVLWYETPIAVSKGPGAVVSITHSVIGDPLFAADGYHIRAGSAAIGRGVPTPLKVDIDHQERPSAPALGADEYWLSRFYMPITLRQQ